MTTMRSAYRWFPWSIAGAMTMVVAVNLVFAYFAIWSSPGLVSEHPYDEGNGYNAVLDAAARQEALGWNGKLSFIALGEKRGEIAATFSDRAGHPLDGLSVTAHIERPIEPLPELVISLAASGAGRYAAAAQLSRPGQWDVRIIARRGDALYEFDDRIFVK